MVYCVWFDLCVAFLNTDKHNKYYDSTASTIQKYYDSPTTAAG